MSHASTDRDGPRHSRRMWSPSPVVATTTSSMVPMDRSEHSILPVNSVSACDADSSADCATSEAPSPPSNANMTVATKDSRNVR